MFVYLPFFSFQQNFKILLKEAIIADRHDYVSVLLEEDDVQLGSNQVSDIYQVYNERQSDRN